MARGVSFVWIPFDSYNDQYSVLRWRVKQNIYIANILRSVSNFLQSREYILFQDCHSK